MCVLSMTKIHFFDGFFYDCSFCISWNTNKNISYKKTDNNR